MIRLAQLPLLRCANLTRQYAKMGEMIEANAENPAISDRT